VIAMAGNNCVGICRYALALYNLSEDQLLNIVVTYFSDLRLGAQAQTVSMDFEKVR